MFYYLRATSSVENAKNKTVKNISSMTIQQGLSLLIYDAALTE